MNLKRKPERQKSLCVLETQRYHLTASYPYWNATLNLVARFIDMTTFLVSPNLRPIFLKFLLLRISQRKNVSKKAGIPDHLKEAIAAEIIISMENVICNKNLYFQVFYKINKSYLPKNEGVIIDF